MELRPGYKRTEVGVIPEDWEVQILGQLGEFKNGINKGKEDFGHGFPFVNLLDVFGIAKVSNNSVFGLVNASSIERNVYSLSKGDVLFVRSSVKPEGVGLSTLVAEDLSDTVYSGFLIRFRDKGSLTFGFKEHCFRQDGFRSRLIASSTVSANTNINQNALKALLIAFPKSREEQQAIAAALSDVDALISTLDKLIAKKRDIKQAVMQQLLTGKKRLPGFSGEWEVKKLGDIAGITKGQLITEKDAIPGNIPVIAGGKKPSYSHTKPNRTGKTITISASGANAGYISFFDTPIFASDCSTINEGTSYAIEFIYYYLLLKQGEIYKMQTGGAQPHVHAIDLMPLNVEIPDLPEQTAIAAVLSDMDAEIAALERKRDKTRSLKRGMMQELLTGRIRLT